MKLLFFVVACSKAIRRCNQESIDEGKGETTNATYLYMLNIVFYTKIKYIQLINKIFNYLITPYSKENVKRHKCLHPMLQG